MSAKVAKLSDYRNRDTVQILETLLHHAKAGEISGAIVAWCATDGKLGGRTTGVYAENHVLAMGAVFDQICRTRIVAHKRRKR